MIAIALLLGYAAAASAQAVWWPLCAVHMVNASPKALPLDIHLARNQGFCSPGVFPSTKPARELPRGLKQWGSYCAEGDRSSGVAETSPFTAPPYIELYLAGYVSNPGLTLEIENLASHSRLPVIPPAEAREQWVGYYIQLPSSWRGNPVRFIAQDHSTHRGGWFAFSTPLPGNGTSPGTREATTLLLRTLLYFVLLILPALLAAAFAIRRGLRDLVSLGLLQLAAIGAYGYLFFVLWFIAPKLGHLFSLLLPIAGAFSFPWIYRRLDAAGRRILKDLFVPLALAGAASLLVSSLGFAYGGLDQPLETAAQRFSHQLPPDNTIPYLFAEAIRDGHVPTPLQADWLSSDRPPLQTGLVLSQYGYVSHPRLLVYMLISVIAQSLWIFAAWLLLTALYLDARAIALVLAVCLLSGFVFLNSFYVWPKLLAAAYMLGLFAILFTPKYQSLRSSRFLGMLAGIMLAFSMLSHGGTAFALIGTVLTMLILRRRIPFKTLALIALSAFILYLPWLLYQKLYDPPGNRLLKMHLAGVNDIDSRSLSESLRASYGALALQQYLANKSVNLHRPFQNSAKFWVEIGDLVRYFNDPVNSRQIAAVMRGWMFFHIVANLGFLMIGPVVLLAGILKKYRTREWRAAAVMWLFIVLTDLVWSSLMFRPGMTVIHAGTYATILLGYAASVLAIWAVSRFLAVAIACLQVSLNVLLYVVFMRPPQPANALVFEPPLLLGCLFLGALSLLCVLWLLSKLSRTALGSSGSSRMRQELPVAFGAGDRTVHQLRPETGPC